MISMKNKKDFLIKLNKDRYYVFSLAVQEHIFYWPFDCYIGNTLCLENCSTTQSFLEVRYNQWVSPRATNRWDSDIFAIRYLL